MAVNRRRWLQSLALTGAGGSAAKAAESALTLEALRNVSAAHGTNLSDVRLRVVRPVIERRQADLRALREFEIDDSVAPVQGILEK